MLTKREYEILDLLAVGRNYSEICALLGIAPSNIHNVVSRIRKKTGIINTKNPDECRDFIRSVPMGSLVGRKRLRKLSFPTVHQAEAMSLFARGNMCKRIALILHITPQTALNAISMGCKRAGIPCEREAIRQYLETEYYNESLEKASTLMDDPMF